MAEGGPSSCAQVVEGGNRAPLSLPTRVLVPPWAPLSRPHTSHRPHLLIPPPWGFEFQQRNFEGPKCSVHCKNLQWLPSSLGQRPQFLTKLKTFHGPVPSPAAPSSQCPPSAGWSLFVPTLRAECPVCPATLHVHSSVWSPFPPRLCTPPTSDPPNPDTQGCPRPPA